MKSSFINFFTIIAFLLLLTNCASFKSKPSIDLATITPKQIIQKIEENNARITTLSGKGTLAVEIPETPFQGEMTIRVARPDSLYIFTEAAFGIDIGFLFADGKQFHSYSPMDNIYLIGPAGQIGSMVLFNLKIAYKDLLNSVLGAASFPLQRDTKVDLQGSKFVIQQQFEGSNLVYEVDSERFVITRIQLFDEQKNETFRQVFRRFRKIKGIWVPQHIQLTRPQTKERLTVWYTKVDLNQPLAADLFTYKIPENAERYRLKE